MRTTEVALALLERGGRWFLQRRDPAGAVLPGLWEFPGGKVEPGETPEAACFRELQEELGLGATACVPLGTWTHDYGDRRVVLRAFRVEAPGQPRTELAWGWFTPPEIRALPIPEANGALVASLH